jgi:hypothetical protein
MPCGPSLIQASAMQGMRIRQRMETAVDVTLFTIMAIPSLKEHEQ